MSAKKTERKLTNVICVWAPGFLKSRFYIPISFPLFLEYLVYTIRHSGHTRKQLCFIYPVFSVWLWRCQNSFFTKAQPNPSLFIFYIKKFVLTIINKPIVLYCLMFSLIFALFVGATTLNFGSLVRYKIPALPFYLLSRSCFSFLNMLKNKPPITAP